MSYGDLPFFLDVINSLFVQSNLLSMPGYCYY